MDDFILAVIMFVTFWATMSSLLGYTP